MKNDSLEMLIGDDPSYILDDLSFQIGYRIKRKKKLIIKFDFPVNNLNDNIAQDKLNKIIFTLAFSDAFSKVERNKYKINKRAFNSGKISIVTGNIFN